MNNAIRGLRESLTRKFGPLPVWAWAALTGAAIFVYRTRHAASGLVDNTGTPQDSSTAPEPQAPVTLQPGESAYDPNTGQLVGTAPEQQAPQTPTPLEPITLAPGEQIYDPNTGQLVGNPQTTTTQGAPATQPKKAQTNVERAAARAAAGKGGTRTIATLVRAGYTRGQVTHAIAHKTPLGTPKGKRSNKGKNKSSNPARQPTHGKSRARSSASTRQAVHGTTGQGSSAGRVRGRVPSTKPAPRARPTVSRAASLRQRPAPPRAVNHSAQKVETHPARRPTAKKRGR